MVAELQAVRRNVPGENIHLALIVPLFRGDQGYEGCRLHLQGSANVTCSS